MPAPTVLAAGLNAATPPLELKAPVGKLARLRKQQHPGMKFDLKSGIGGMMRDRLHAAPFQSFVVVLPSGERLRVKNPDMLRVTLSGWVIYDDGAKERMLNPALLAEIETESAKI